MTSAPDPSAHLRGFVMTLIGVLVLTPDTLLIRLIGTDPWTMSFWRGALMAGPLMIAFAAVHRGDAMRQIRALGAVGVLVAAIYAVNAITFVLAVEETKVANVLVILAATPLFSALMAVVFLKEVVRGPTWAAIAAGILGVGIVVSEGIRAGTTVGEVYALVTALSLAAGFTIIRRHRGLNMVPATALGAVFAALAVTPWAAPLSLDGGQWVWMLIMGLAVLPVAFGLITLGPRTVPAPEVALLLLLETVLGPLWVWLAIGEGAGVLTFVGGAVVVAAVGLHALWRLAGGGRRGVMTG